MQILHLCCKQVYVSARRIFAIIYNMISNYWNSIHPSYFVVDSYSAIHFFYKLLKYCLIVV